MPDAWRVDQEKWQDSSFDGNGAAREGGRWNSAGVRVIYASGNLAMASLEKYVHLPKPVPAAMRFVRFRVDFNGVAVKQLKPADLPANWTVSPVPPETQNLGDEWIASNETAVLAVPSSIIPDEWNFLLNPAHPDFKKLTIHPPEEFIYNDRVARLIEPPKR